jgi:hypothetical protein
MSAVPASVITYFAIKNNYDRSEAETLFEQLESFLGSGTGSCRVPSKAVDDAWHAFILHTREYAIYCMNQFGRFIDHVPEPVVSDAIDNGDQAMCTRCSSNCRTS